MEENKVIMTLSQYDELKRKEYLLENIKDYVLSYAELEDGKMKLDYNLRYSNVLTDFFKRYFSEDYEEKLSELKRKEEK